MNLELLLWWFFGTLAVFRISCLISKEDGPWWIFCKLRKLPPAKSSAREGLSCPLCLSFYASALICGLFAWAGLRLPWQLWPVLWLAMSSGAIVLNQAFVKDL